MPLHVEIAGVTKQYFEDNGGNGKGDEDLELPLFDFTTLARATNGFSATSKLGEGGFGPVYKVIVMLLNLIWKLDNSRVQNLNDRLNF